MDNRIGFGSRFGAMLADAVLVTIAIGVLGPILGGMLGAAAGAATDGGKDLVAAGAMVGGIAGLVYGGPIIGLLYFAVEAFTGATFGKMMLGQRAGSVTGTAAPTGQLMFRYCCKHPHFILGTLAAVTPLTFLGPLGGALGMIAFFGCFAALGEHKQALHDMIARTAVFPKAALQPSTATPPAMPAI